MELIEHQELDSAQSEIEFIDIPQTFTDLYLTISARTALSNLADEFYIYFNGSTTGYSYRTLIGTPNNGSAASNTSSIGYLTGNTATASTFSSNAIYIPNYTSSNNKSYSHDGASETNGTTTRLSINAGLWSNTAAITSVEIKSQTANNLLQYTSASLFGVRAGSDGIVAVS
jgi:hypothetical protein